MKSIKKFSENTINYGRVGFVNFFSKIFRITDRDFGEREKIVYFSAVSCFLILLMAIGGTLQFLLSYPVEEQRDSAIINAITLGSCAVIVIAANLLFLVFRSFHLLFFLVCTSVAIALEGIHIFQHLKITGGILSGSPVGIMQILVAFVFAFSGNMFQIIFWWSLTFILFVVSLIIDIRWSDATAYFEQIKIHEDQGNILRIPTVYIYVYMPYFFNIIIIFVILLIQRGKKRRTEKVIDLIGESILSLNFDNEEITKLENAELKNLTKNEILFQGLLKNVKLYKSFLPDTITKIDHNSEASSMQDDEGTTSISSTISEESSGNNKDGNSNPSSSLPTSLSLPKSFQKLNTNFSKLSRGSKGSNGSRGRTKKTGNEIFKSRTKKRDIFFGLKRKEIVVMLVDSGILNRYDSRKANSVAIINELMIQFANIVCSKVYNNNGIIHENNATSIVITFNAQKIVVDPALRAATCAFQILQQFKRMKTDFDPVISIVKAKHLINGIVKNEYHSKFHLISPKIKLMYQILDKCKAEIFDNEKENIFVGQEIKNDLKFGFLCKQVNVINAREFRDFEMQDIFRLIEKDKVGENNPEGEWFYQIKDFIQKPNLEDKGKKTMIHLFNSCWNELKNKNFENANSLIETYVKNIKELDVDLDFLQKKLFKMEKE